MTEIEYSFLSFHVLTWIGIATLASQIQGWKKEIRQHIDYDSSLRAMRKNRRNK